MQSKYELYCSGIARATGGRRQESTARRSSHSRVRPHLFMLCSHANRTGSYVSVVIDCPYSGHVDPVKVKDVTRALLDMGCYEVSLGDTVGTGNPTTVADMLETLLYDTGIPPAKLAVSALLRVLLCTTFYSLAPGSLPRHIRNGRLEHLYVSRAWLAHVRLLCRWTGWLPILSWRDRQCRH